MINYWSTFNKQENEVSKAKSRPKHDNTKGPKKLDPEAGSLQLLDSESNRKQHKRRRKLEHKQ